MSIKKSLLALAAAALTTMAFASPAMAEGDRVVEVDGSGPITNGTELHFVGWASFLSGSNGMKCHVAATTVATGSEGQTSHVKTFTVPDTSKCTGSGFFSYQGCNALSSHEATTTNAKGEHTWDVTTRQNDFDVFNSDPGPMVLHFVPEGSCAQNGDETTLTFENITLTPLKTGSTGSGTGNLDNLGDAAATGEQIAGVRLSGSGKAHTNIGELNVEASGELELTAPNRCTWKLSA